MFTDIKTNKSNFLPVKQIYYAGRKKGKEQESTRRNNKKTFREKYKTAKETCQKIKKGKNVQKRGEKGKKKTIQKT